MTKYVILFIVLLITAGCGKPEPTADSAAVEKEIEQLNEHREREWNNEE